MRNFALLSAAVAGLAAAGPVAPEVDSLFNHPDVVPEQGLGARAVPAKCNADNCARAVTGTAKGLPAQSARSADCASFFQYTYVPPTFTRTVYFTPYLTQSTTTTLATTSTQTVTATTSSYSNVLQNQPARRAEDTGSLIIPSSVPAYASPCSGTVRFSSACACWGFSPVTQTAAAPTTVLTITAETVTTIEVAVSLQSFFSNLILSGTNANLPHRQQPK
ncbi:hypothetical protein DL98DRAFT_44338 [Cadophora sp. DSE1049]|nr:hypothetical protein DL98DRAFT_44338 [Cadophora sp. DSE1049]